VFTLKNGSVESAEVLTESDYFIDDIIGGVAADWELWAETDLIACFEVSDSQDANVPYEWNVTTVRDTPEPDDAYTDQSADASFVPANSTQTDTFTTPGDRDAFQIELDRGDRLTMEAFAPAAANDFTVRIRSAEDGVFSLENGSVESAEVSTESDYFIDDITGGVAADWELWAETDGVFIISVYDGLNANVPYEWEIQSQLNAPVTGVGAQNDSSTPTEEPTEPPTEEPTEPPTEEPTEPPTEEPTEPPTEEPTEPPTEEPTEPPTEEPTEPPTEEPTETPEPEPEDTTTDSSATRVGFEGSSLDQWTIVGCNQGGDSGISGSQAYEGSQSFVLNSASGGGDCHAYRPIDVTIDDSPVMIGGYFYDSTDDVDAGNIIFANSGGTNSPRLDGIQVFAEDGETTEVTTYDSEGETLDSTEFPSISQNTWYNISFILYPENSTVRATVTNTETGDRLGSAILETSGPSQLEYVTLRGGGYIEDDRQFFDEISVSEQSVADPSSSSESPTDSSDSETVTGLSIEANGYQRVDGDNVRLTLQASAEESQAVLLDVGPAVENLPGEWSIVNRSDDGGTWRASESVWLFQSVGPDNPAEPSIVIEPPENASGEYTQTAQAESDEYTASDNFTFTVRESSLLEAVDQNNDGQIDDGEILAAIEWWRNDQIVPNTDMQISNQQILEIVEVWQEE
jgi:cell division septation protein DedD